MTFCDLHLHSTASDGTTPPARLASQARRLGLRAIALTDHDTTAGIPRAAAACARHGIDFVPGIELSAQAPAAPGQTEAVGTLHLLGYFVRHDEPTLLEIQRQVQAARADRNPRMVERLRELGVDITYDEVIALADSQGGPGVIGRPHIAQVMVNKGYARTVHEAFTRYIGQGAPAYVRKDRLPPADAIAAIRQAGGLAVLAHPVHLRLPTIDDLARFVARLRQMGLDGIETRHSDHSPADVRAFEQLAARFRLLTTGGSDYHGSRKPIAMGNQNVPLAVYEKLRDARAKR